MIKMEWYCEELGWWTHPDYGGVCQDKEGKWWAYPKEKESKWWAYPEEHRKIGPFRSRRAAMLYLEEKP
jgi:hypothetical protein